MRAVDLIVKKREGGELTGEEISFLVDGYVRDRIPDYQMASLAMAVFFRGMSFQETGHLTQAMIRSGELIDLSGLPGPLVDKHSTGGVGDKVSLILAPLAAACGLQVPMMSGRALGHTGGTLDKLESIPGYRTDLTVERFRDVIASCGYAMIGQSERIVPADRQLYGLRDVTGTVESIPLITASIMSKKFAEGAGALVFDVKCGSGAFMKSREQAEALAVSLVRTGESLGRKVRAVITDMNAPLGRKVGNFLEVRESAECLQGSGPPDLMEVTLRLAARMLMLGGLASSLEEAEASCRRALTGGTAWERFLSNVELQGGDPAAVREPGAGPRARYVEPVSAQESGYVGEIDAYLVGLAAGALGASRSRKEDPVLAEVGVELLKVRGEEVGRDEPLCLMHAADRGRLKEAGELMRRAYTLAARAPSGRPLIVKEIG